MIRRIGAAAFLVALLACGKRGDPRPPVPIIPQATSDLVVTQRADQVILSWSYPSLTTTGRALTAVERISVFRYVEDLPVSATGSDPNALMPGNIDPTVPQPVALFSKLPTLPQAQFAKLGTRVESIEKANLPAATAGSKLLFVDRPPFTTTDGRPVRVTYAVVTEGETARSEYSNLAIIVPLPVAVPPVNLAATPAARGVTLKWAAPTASVRGAGVPPVIHGYHIYRTAPGQALNEFVTPINNAPVKETTYTDTPPYGEHEYRVAAVAVEGPPRVQSNLSEPVRATFKDLVPPPVPASVTPLLETNRVRLIWDAVDAPDLDGYIVYRIEGTIRLRLAPWIIKETNFTDISLDIGIAYHYEVTSIDASGNESAAVKSETIIVPKTP
ncbi:MAG TPA: hypothetical protein VEK11_00765 [Thermoanaerobaculia bacterium]|nr:hypothetical protein [Thermoanaerobaculia bacterium]